MAPHTRIPLNPGSLGKSASSGKTIVVDDVSKRCTLSRVFAREHESEIVVPIFVKIKLPANWISIP